ncbi:GGDEF domain-containing protein [Methylobacterium sp. 092160098-2]|uniref:GGDEF domain-containing protein n=1 Tax=Methylobacterium sp. 092160098-2 TaxID=3025129 RepID=UPI002381A6FE|nr:GGDEF domain-containing protein [Methylobacterium sp. 092160098-2]MDE4914782.1 GGDEF domain-containing protein [Methylobacterium sp. 092160098-2]
MQIDLQTLWYLTVGTLVVSAALLLWERQAHPGRAGVLGTLIGGLVAFVAGCLVAMNRSHLPVALGMGATNLLMMTGYLLVLNAAAGLDGKRHARSSVCALGALGVVWAVVGSSFPAALWNHVSALPIALACALTAWTLLRSRTVQGLRSRPVAVSVLAAHALFYLGRAFVAPVLVQHYGPDVLPMVAKATMFEAVLFAVAMPMSFLALIREEDRRHLLRMSHTDQLTGLANRHAFFEQGARVLAARRGGEPIALLAFDLDHFKAINDRHGHAVGDEVLRLFAEVARETAGPSALLVRLGGEEFAALLPGLGPRQARRVGLAIARRFTAAAAREDGPGIHATVSIGLASQEAGPRGLAEMLVSADRALYQAKALGRNRLESAEPQELQAA